MKKDIQNQDNDQKTLDMSRDLIFYLLKTGTHWLFFSLIPLSLPSIFIIMAMSEKLRLRLL